MSGETPFDQRVAEAVFRVEAMSRDITEIRASTARISDAIAKMAIIEERQITSNQAMERAFKSIEGLGVRMAVLEMAQPLQKQTSDWVNKVIYLVIGAVVSGIVSMVMITKTPGFMERNTMTMTPGK